MTRVALLLSLIIPAAPSVAQVLDCSAFVPPGCACQPGELGVIDVGRYDVNAPFGILDDEEIQCAINCLDGDPDSEACFEQASDFINHPAIDHSAILEFDPGLRHEIRRTLVLPARMQAKAMFTIEGNGAVIRAAPDFNRGAHASGALMARTIWHPLFAAIRDAPGPRFKERPLEYFIGSWANVTTIRDLVFDGSNVPVTGRPDGLELHFTFQPLIESVEFRGLRVGLETHGVFPAMVRSCVFKDNLWRDVHLGNLHACGDDNGLNAPCYVRADGTTGYGGENGANNTLIQSTTHSSGPSGQQETVIHWHESSSVQVANALFEGPVRPRHVVRKRGFGMDQSTIRDVIFRPCGTGTCQVPIVALPEPPEDPACPGECEKRDALVRLDAQNEVLKLDGVILDVDHDDPMVLLDLPLGVPGATSEAGRRIGSTALVELSRVPVMPSNLFNKPDRESESRVLMRDVANSLDLLTNCERWQDAVIEGESEFPNYLRVDDHRLTASLTGFRDGYSDASLSFPPGGLRWRHEGDQFYRVQVRYPQRPLSASLTACPAVPNPPPPKCR